MPSRFTLRTFAAALFLLPTIWWTPTPARAGQALWEGMASPSDMSFWSIGAGPSSAGVSGTIPSGAKKTTLYPSGLPSEKKSHGGTLREIQWAERADNPMYIYAFAEPFTGVTWPMPATPNLTIGSGSQGQYHRLGADPNTHTAGIQVCTNDPADASKREFKGLRMWSVPHPVNGVVANDIAGYMRSLEDNPESYPMKQGVHYAEKKQANCAKWHKPSWCIYKGVAVGLTVYYTEDRGVAALQLVCRSVGSADHPTDDPIHAFPGDGSYLGTTFRFNVKVKSPFPGAKGTVTLSSPWSNGISNSRMNTPIDTRPFEIQEASGEDMRTFSIDKPWTAFGCAATATECTVDVALAYKLSDPEYAQGTQTNSMKIVVKRIASGSPAPTPNDPNAPKKK